MAEYESVQRGSLKLKGVSDGGIKKKKKKKKKDKEAIMLAQTVSSGGECSSQAQERTETRVDSRTASERAFQKAREKRDTDTIIDRASKTYKERILDFNKHLDNLSEHYDIPKVSWTK